MLLFGSIYVRLRGTQLAGEPCEPASKQATLPCAGDELDDRAEEQERAVEGQADVPPVPPEQPVQHLEPLQMRFVRTSLTDRLSTRKMCTRARFRPASDR